MKKFFQSSYQNIIAWLFTGLLGFFALIFSTTLVAQEIEISGSGNYLFENADNRFSNERGKFIQVSINEVAKSLDSTMNHTDDLDDYQLHSEGLGAGWGSVSRVLP